MPGDFQAHTRTGGDKEMGTGVSYVGNSYPGTGFDSDKGIDPSSGQDIDVGHGVQSAIQDGALIAAILGQCDSGVHLGTEIPMLSYLMSPLEERGKPLVILDINASICMAGIVIITQSDFESVQWPLLRPYTMGGKEDQGKNNC